MRLWHYTLIPHLPRQQLLGQHRECCGMRGEGWGQKHSTVDYVWKHHYYRLFDYHLRVMSEMNRRGYNHDELWEFPFYRGKSLPEQDDDFTQCPDNLKYLKSIYPEHNDEYLTECLNNLLNKGIDLSGVIE